MSSLPEHQQPEACSQEEARRLAEFLQKSFCCVLLNLHTAEFLIVPVQGCFLLQNSRVVGQAEFAGGVVDNTSGHGLFYLHSVRLYVFFSLDEDYYVGVNFTWLTSQWSRGNSLLGTLWELRCKVIYIACPWSRST